MPVTRGTLSGIEARSTSTAHPATTMAQTVPAAASTRLSIMSWRISRQRLAPSAARTATSRSRALARASSRLAMFAHVISRTRPTAASSINIHALIRAPTM